jgi:hypothetical protein
VILSELLRREVVDTDGRRLGKVHDVLLAADLPAGGGNRAGLRIEALVVGRSGIAARLGYDANDVQGPWLLRWMARLLERRLEHVMWNDVIWSDGDGDLVVRTDRHGSAPR